MRCCTSSQHDQFQSRYKLNLQPAADTGFKRERTSRDAFWAKFPRLKVLGIFLIARIHYAGGGGADNPLHLTLIYVHNYVILREDLLHGRML